jgi:hypothetical protein
MKNKLLGRISYEIKDGIKYIHITTNGLSVKDTKEIIEFYNKLMKFPGYIRQLKLKLLKQLF